MQEVFTIIALSIIQGILEFLPVSSFAHAKIVSGILAFSDLKNLQFFLEFATFLCVLFYFRSILIGNVLNLFSKQRKESIAFFLKIALATLPSLIAFPVLSVIIKKLGIKVSLALVAGSILMFIAEFFFKKKKHLTLDLSSISFKQSFIVGCFQVLSIFSGFSRSGSTICSGLICGFSRDLAVRFSFLISLPIALLKLIYDFQNTTPTLTYQTILGFTTCLVIAFIFIKPCFNLISRVKLTRFAIYRIILAIFLTIQGKQL